MGAGRAKNHLDQILTKPKEKPGRLGTDRDESVNGFPLEIGLFQGFQGNGENSAN